MTITKLKVRYYGDPCLRKKAQIVKEVGPSERLLINSMIATMHFYKGIGLAAPQVGINQRIFVIDVGEDPIAVINPKIIKRVGSAVMEEGCLSIPEVIVNVKRPQEIIVQYQDENNHTQEKTFKELLARVFLHENDHLNGKLIVDYADNSQLKELKAKLKQIEEGKIPE